MSAVPIETTPSTSGSDSRETEVGLLLPPAQTSRLQLQPGDGPVTRIDYAAHPAYAAHVTDATVAATVKSMVGFGRSFALILFKRLVSYELIPGHLRRPDSPLSVLRLAQKAGGHVLRAFAPRSTFAPTTKAGRAVQERLQVDGICVAALDASRYATLSRAVQPLFEALRRTRGQRDGGGREFDESRSYALRTAHGELFGAVDSILTSSGLLDGISAYLGRPASLVDVNPQINDVTDDFWRRIFSDLPVEDRPAAYLHRDASGGDIKAIFYMSDVGAENGPFSFVLGSHLHRSGTVGNWIEEANDQSGFSGTGPVNRRRFAALPASLRRKCAFGNDLPADSPVQARIRDAEWTITAPGGSVVLFDTKGFHRGGMVRQGERLALTCVIG